MAVRSAGEAGNGCFATPTSPSCPSGGGAAFIEAGTTVLEGLMPLVWAVNDEYESRNCRSAHALNLLLSRRYIYCCCSVARIRTLRMHRIPSSASLVLARLRAQVGLHVRSSKPC